MISRAHLHAMPMAVRKVRIVLDLIRGKPVEDAYRILTFVPKRGADPVLKLLRSAVANAGQKGGPGAAELVVSRVYADGGKLLPHRKRLEPKAMMRHGVVKGRPCHVTIELDQRQAVMKGGR